MPVTEKAEITLTVEGEPVKLRIRLTESTNVEWIGWTETGEPLMVVQFKGGGRYGYIGVTRQKAVAVANAKSTGIYINSKIKPHHRVVKIR